MNLKTWIVVTVMAMLATAAQGADSMQAKAAMEGNWQLEEWHSDGEILRSPQAEGRFSVRDGVVMVLMHRDLNGTRKSNYDYGTYAFSDDTWTYGYDRYVIFTDTGSSVTAGPGPFDSKRTFQIKYDGGKTILDNDNGRWVFVFDGDTFTYFDKGKLVRKWRRILNN
jgi:hypothetical protein